MFNITGLRIQATARIDRTGYDVTQRTFSLFIRVWDDLTICLIAVGPYQVRPGQVVYVKDPAISKPDGTSASGAGTPTASSPPRVDTPDIYLRISHTLPAGQTELEGLQGGFQFPLFEKEAGVKALSFDIVAATATFGGNPAMPRNSGPPSTTPNSSYQPKKAILPPLMSGLLTAFYDTPGRFRDPGGRYREGGYCCGGGRSYRYWYATWFFLLSSPVFECLIFTLIGGSAKAAGDLVAKSGGKTAEYIFVIGLTFLKGGEKLDAPFYSIIESDD